MSGTIRLQTDSSAAEIALRGAELLTWRVGNRPLIWSPDPSIWADTAPILFPVVGWTRDGQVRVDGKTYPLGLHGFARTLPFRLAGRGGDWARLLLESSTGTQALFPFDFTLSITYRLTGNALETELAVHNAGTGAMPYACGLHPGFSWPFAGGALDDYAIEFEVPERADVPVITAAGLFTKRHRAVDMAGRRLALSHALFAREALCFLDARSRSLRFAHAEGAALTLTFEDFPHLAFWSRPGGRFLCIEAWTGYGDLEDSDGNLWTKPSMIRLDSGATRRHAATYVFAAGR